MEKTTAFISRSEKETEAFAEKLAQEKMNIVLFGGNNPEKLAKLK